MSKVYDAPALRALSRTMTYSRSGAGSVEIMDDFNLTQPTDVEESFPTHGTVRQIDATTFEFSYEKARLRVKIDSPTPVTLIQETVTDYGVTFLRVGLRTRLSGPAKIRMHFTDAS